MKSYLVKLIKTTPTSSEKIEIIINARDHYGAATEAERLHSSEENNKWISEMTIEEVE